jgi:nucleotide-binding universal stress UspA family protein
MDEIIVGVDGSETAMKAAKEAADLARSCGRRLHLVSAVAKRGGKEIKVGSDNWHVDYFSDAEQNLKALSDSLALDPPATWSVVVGEPANALIDEAERLKASIIVVGNRRVQGVARVLGSVAADVAKQAPCNVLIAHTT